MISVVIPTLNSGSSLARTLACMVGPTAAGLVRQVIVADGGSADETLAIVDASGADLVRAPKGRGTQLAAGARQAKGDWLLFLHSDTVLQTGWEDEVKAFVEQVDRAGRAQAAVFRFALNDFSPQARRLEFMVQCRCRLLALPYGDQGLLVRRDHYEAIGGFRDMPIMEDVDIVRRIGRKDLVFLKSSAVTSAQRFRARGFILQPIRNALLLGLYFLKVPPRILVRLYG